VSSRSRTSRSVARDRRSSRRRSSRSRSKKGSAFFNPFGIWRLDRIEEGENWSKESYHAIK